MLSIFEYDFMIRAFIAGLAVAVIAPLIGTFLVVKRFSLIADTLSHIALAGVAIGLLLSVQPLVTTLVITVIAAILIEYLRTNKKIPGDAILAMFLPGGLALSIVLLAYAKGFNANLFSFLFGSISTVTQTDLYLIVALAVVTVIIIFALYKKLFFTAIDEESATIAGVPVRLMNTILVVLTAVTVSLAMRVVGILLVGALMVIPSVTAMQIARSFKQTLSFAVLFAVLAVVLGLFIAYYFSLPAGGAIVLLSLGIFVIVGFLFKRK